MAALLCQSVSSLCSGLCSGCGTVCKLPCTMCSSACSALCSSCKNLCTSHFCIYGTVALGLNIPPIVFALTASSYVGCKGTQWMLVNSLFSLVHISAAFYLANQPNSWNDIMHTLCYDPWMAGYIIISAISFIWISNGLSMAMGGAMDNGNCPENISTLTYNSIYFGFAFFGIGLSALLISVLVSTCLGRRNGKAQTNDTTNNKESYVPPFAAKV